MTSSSDNGSEGREAEQVPVDQVILTYDRIHDHLEVGGAFGSIDLALDMLGRARRALEAKLRAQQAMELQAQLQRARQDAAVAEALRKTR